MNPRAAAALRGLRLAWIALIASIAAWPPAGGSAALAVIAALPLVAALPWLWTGADRALRLATLALAPAIALAITELVANAALRIAAAITLALAFAAFAALLAALRARADR